MQTKHIIIFMVLILQGILGYAQQDPMFTQYQNNMMAVNSAYAGSKEALNVVAISRHQWVNFEGAPTTQSIAINTPFFDKELGLGFSFVRDQVGPLKTDNFYIDIAYKLKVHEGGHLSMGLKSGLHNRKNNLRELNPLNENDPSFQKDIVSELYPNFGTGFYYYTDKYYLGVSAPKLSQIGYRKDDNPNLGNNEMKRHYYVVGGYVWDINQQFQFKPTFLTKMVQGAPPSFDISANVRYNNKIIGGISHRFGDSFGALIQVKALSQIWIGYSYDFTISEMSRYNSGTHEIMINLDLNLPKKDIIESSRFF